MLYVCFSGDTFRCLYQNTMKIQLIFFLTCCIDISSQLTGYVCTYDRYENCCANSENIDGICTQCRIGTTTDARGRCVPCKSNTYGYKCINTCVCDPFQMCDPELGCVRKTTIPTKHTSYAGTIELRSSANDRATSKEATDIRNETIELVSSSNDRATTRDATDIMSGTSNTEWIIYTLCITGCCVITGLCHLFRTYRKRYDVGFRKVNEEVTLQPLELPSYINDIYDEVDENLLTFVTMGINNTCQASNDEPVNFVFGDRQSDVADYEDCEAGYFDLYFGMQECANQQGENQALQKEGTSPGSSNSNVVSKDNSEYPNPCIPLDEYYQDESHSCEVAVTVHMRIESSSGSDEEATSNVLYSNVCIPLQKDRQKNSLSNESHLSSDDKMVHETTQQTAVPSVYRTGYFQGQINNYIYATSDNEITDCSEIESVKDKIFEYNIPKTL